MFKNVENKALAIREVTLLSVKEAELARQNIPDILKHNDSWWLRSSGIYVDSAAFVRYDGHIDSYGNYVVYDIGVRPALRIDNLESNHLQIGDKIQIANHNWTVISDDLVLCDEIITREPFNPDKNRGNDYESSHIKEFVNKWGKDMQLTRFD